MQLNDFDVLEVSCYVEWIYACSRQYTYSSPLFGDGSMRDRTDTSISCYDDLHNARGLFMKHHFMHKLYVFWSEYWTTYKRTHLLTHLYSATSGTPANYCYNNNNNNYYYFFMCLVNDLVANNRNANMYTTTVTVEEKQQQQQMFKAQLWSFIIQLLLTPLYSRHLNIFIGMSFRNGKKVGFRPHFTF